MKEGWICPRCDKVNAPFIEQCTCKSNNSTTSNFDVDWAWNGDLEEDTQTSLPQEWKLLVL